MIENSRFKDAPWIPNKKESCIVGGAGGIGSWLTLFLSRAGFSPIVFDFDIIEDHNLGGQLFPQSSIGELKVFALKEMIKNFSNGDLETFNKKVDENTMSHYFCFSAFDNMKARRDLFNSWKRSWDKCMVTPIFIDGRLMAEQLQIFCVTPSTADKYENEHLFDDSEVEDAPCTFKQTSHCAAMIGGLMTGFFTNHMTNVYEGEKYRDVPFYYEYFVPVTLVNIE
jgi:molybdopterin/thiamine biosynthesis adenylyltransferase